MDSHDEAVDFCLQEEQWVIGENYKPNHTRFNSTFINDDANTTPQQSTNKNNNQNSNFLSIIQMTDEAISHLPKNSSQVNNNRNHHPLQK